MAGTIYKKPILFAITVTGVILIGTIVMMVYPMLTPQMHPKLQNLRPYTALELAGRDVYQSEGCFYCHTKTVRPLKAEVVRYGAFSKAGEFAYDQPFLWGSRRVGSDLARIGGKYPDEWHYVHFKDPRKLHPGSNMPSYAWLADRYVNVKAVEARMRALGFPYTKEEIKALSGKTKLDALVAYIQSLGHAVPRQQMPRMIAEGEQNPFAGDPTAIAEGKKLYEMNCLACHGIDARGVIGPSLTDAEWFRVVGPIRDDTIFFIIADGMYAGQEFEGRKAKGVHPSFGKYMDKRMIWSIVSYIRSIEE
jgi:cytochrome c oxidase cbb3-type subunit 2